MGIKLIRSIVLCLLLSLVLSSVAVAAPSSQTSSNVLHVKQTVSGLADCSSWENACGLQDALDVANSGDQIWVAAGTYQPTKGGTSTFPNALTFNLETGVEVYGGFPAEGGEWGDRDPATHLTVLSGDIGIPGDDSDNSYHVVTARNVDHTAILDGFTISGGRANGSVGGGGMYNERSSPTLNNLTFTGNEGRFGGGMYSSGSSPNLTDVTFINNYGYYGGGILNSFSSPTLNRVSFIRNDTGNFGGGMTNSYHSSPKLTNITFSSNHADGLGGGMANLDDSSPELTNVTFIGNSVGTDHLGEAIYNFRSSHVLLRNAIVWGNTPSLNQIYNDATSSTIVNYSIVMGGYEGETNIDSDPLLGPLADNGGFTQTHALGAGSPAIDVANPSACPATDQRGHLRLIDGNGEFSEICDIGAYEFGYALNVDIEGSGSVVISPDKPDYYVGETVVLTANPASDWAFFGWSGDATGNENPLVLTFDGDKTITAHFTQTLFRYILVPIYK